ncbi:sulfur carrier protein ThiS [Chitinispirillales bacterium ANBcel5]|uniref:sulfur carrier protein ThiS n=1 Tax=Cellulosispirillum alkaliphilum TaxID=3039283 RepID=UPI002A587630|nr:sulfur carrier protein ThiS [Chitinispirillales bacterium ANBcel5]
MNVTIKLNGENQKIENGSSLLDLIHSRSIEPLHVVVELNGDIVDRKKFETTLLHDEDKVEMLRFVGGG